MKRFLSLCAALALTLAACAAPAESAGAEQAGSAASPAGQAAAPAVLVYGSGDYTRINPALDEHGEINALLFDGLTAHGQGNEIEPRLAESWEVSPDACTYTFHLRDGVLFHDGEPLTSADVKFTFEAIMDPANESENASNYEDVLSIETPDDTTVVFTLSAPNYAFLDYMTMAILPQHLLQGEDMQTADFFRAPVGTGPYKLAAWEAGQAITLTKNEAYFLPPAKIDTIIFKIVPDSSARALQLRSGELDLAQITPKDAASFRDAAGFAVYDMQTSDYRGILYNFNNEYWQKNADLIPAISCAIDRQAMVDAVLLGAGEPAYSPLQRNVYNDPTVERYDYDPARAAALLEAAGCVKDAEGYYCRGGERIGFTLDATSTDQVRIDMAQIAAQQLQAVGLDVKANVPVAIDWGGQQACIIGWGSPFDADDHTYKVFGTGKGANYSGYSDPLVDEYLTQARQTGDPAARAAAYAGFQQALAADPAYTFFCYIDALYVAREGLGGIDGTAVLGHHGVGLFWNVRDWSLA